MPVKPAKKATKATKKAVARTKPKPKMTDERREAIARGQTEARAVRSYLESLGIPGRKRRGRQRTAESITRRLVVLADRLATADALTSLKLTQEMLNLRSELATKEAVLDKAELEKVFIKVARSYSDRCGISYQAWRESGVPAAILKAAGIPRKQ